MTRDRQLTGSGAPVWNLAPPAEIRRRGDRRVLRHRVCASMGATVLGTLAAVALITPGRESTPVANQGQPAAEGTTRLAEDPAEALARGMDVSNLSTRASLEDFSGFITCEGDSWRGPDAIAPIRVVAARGSNEDGSREARALAVFADPTSAQRAASDLRRFATACTSESSSNDRMIAMRVEDHESRWLYLRLVETDRRRTDGLGRLAIMRIGRSLLVARLTNTSGGRPQADRVVSSELAEIAAELCDGESASC